MPQSWVNTEYSIHRVLHHPWSTFSRSQPVSHHSADLVVLNSLHSHDLEFDQCIESRLPSAPFFWYTTSRSTTSKCISKLVWSWPPSVSPNWLNHSLQVRTNNGLQNCYITSSKCILQFTRSRALSASRNSLYHVLQVHLSVYLI